MPDLPTQCLRFSIAHLDPTSSLQRMLTVRVLIFIAIVGILFTTNSTQVLCERSSGMEGYVELIVGQPALVSL